MSDPVEIGTSVGASGHPSVIPPQFSSSGVEGSSPVIVAPSVGGEAHHPPVLAPAAGSAAAVSVRPVVYAAPQPHAQPQPPPPVQPPAAKPARAAPAAHQFPPSLLAQPGAPPRAQTKEELARLTAENLAAAKRSGGVGDAFLKATQWGLQFLGSRTATPDSPEIYHMFFRLARIEAELEELRNTSLHYWNVRRVAHTERIKFNNNIAACGSHSKLGNSAASEVVRHFAAAAHKLESYHDDLDKAFYGLVVNPINDLLINEIRTATALRRQYDSYHLEYDARLSKYHEWREDAKIPETPKRVSSRKEAKIEFDRASAAFEGVKDQLKVVFEVIETKRNGIFNESLSAYMKSEFVSANNTIGTLEQHATAVSSANFASPQPQRAAASGVDVKVPVSAADMKARGLVFVPHPAPIPAAATAHNGSNASGIDIKIAPSVVAVVASSGQPPLSVSVPSHAHASQPAPPTVPSPGAMASAAQASPVAGSNEPNLAPDQSISPHGGGGGGGAEPGSPHTDVR